MYSRGILVPVTANSSNLYATQPGAQISIIMIQGKEIFRISVDDGSGCLTFITKIFLSCFLFYIGLYLDFTGPQPS
jgi:hypothetical protein